MLERESRDAALEDGLALGEQVLDALGVASGDDCLAVSVLLVALDAGGGACSASWVL
jgi:hypothetical protein